MHGPFAKDWTQRREWWDDRLWLQVIIVGIIVLVALLVVYGLSLPVAMITLAVVAGIYGISRVLLR